MIAKIIRIERGKNETIGVLTINGDILCYTLELANNNNERNISCIPLGSYVCKRVTSHKFGNTFEITGVEGRDNIMIHKGNTWNDTTGCVILGNVVGWLNNDRAMLGSGLAWKEFELATKGIDEFNLYITTA